MAQKNSGFIKLIRGEKVNELLKDPNAWTLATIIAYRARRTSSFNIKNLKPGEALLGDYRNYGMTEATYRTTKKKLSEWQIATFKSTNKGTIAKLVDNSIYDINIDGHQRTNQQAINEQTTNQSTGQQRLTKNDKNVKKESFSDSSPSRIKPQLFPIAGKNCHCGLPAVYKSGGDYDNYYCLEHSPDKVKAMYK